MEPEPVGGNSVTFDEEAAKEEEVGEDCDNDHVSDNDVGDHAGEERYEGTSGPEGGEDHEEVEEEHGEAPRSTLKKVIATKARERKINAGKVVREWDVGKIDSATNRILKNHFH